MTDKEVNLKLHLKAEMIRAHIPEQYRAPSPFKGERKTLTSTTAVNQILQSKNEPIRIEKPDLPKTQAPLKTETVNPADRKSWFIPASDKMRPLQRSIEAKLKELQQDRPQQRPSPFSKAQEPPTKTTTYSLVREKVRVEAEIKGAKVPPEYGAEPYERPKKVAEEPQTKGQSSFGEAAKGEKEPQQSKPRMSDTFNMKSGVKDSNQAHLKHNADDKPEPEI